MGTAEVTKTLSQSGNALSDNQRSGYSKSQGRDLQLSSFHSLSLAFDLWMSEIGVAFKKGPVLSLALSSKY